MFGANSFDSAADDDADAVGDWHRSRRIAFERGCAVAGPGASRAALFFAAAAPVWLAAAAAARSLSQSAFPRERDEGRRVEIKQHHHGGM